MPIAPMPSRGEVWLVNFDPATGGEIRKLRPALVISLDAIGRLPLRVVVPITDWKRQYAAYPWFVELRCSPTNGLSKDSGADAFQVKSISQGRFVRRLGTVTTPELDAVASAVALCVGAP
jgi:mRNA interferase MazF